MVDKAKIAKAAKAAKIKKPKKKLGRPIEWTEPKLHALGESLVAHCKKPDAFHIVDWVIEQKHSSTWFYDLMKDYPILAEYHVKAKDILGNKILQMAFQAGNQWAVKTFIPKYLDDVKKHLHDELTAECKIKAEATRDAMTQDPDHPFWETFTQYMEQSGEKAPK